MENQEAAPSTNLDKKDKGITKKNEKEEEITNKNEIILEEPKQKREEKTEEPKENTNEKKIKIEKPKNEIPEKKEIIIDTAKEKKPVKKKREEMDDFEKFMDSYPYKFREFEFDFYGDTLKPDYVLWKNKRKYYCFFDLESLKNVLEEKWKKIFEKHPITLEYLKQPLKDYKKKYQKNIYEEQTGFFETLSTKIKCLIQGETYDEEVRKRAKALAFLLSQVEYKQKQNYIEIAMIDSLTLNINFYPFIVFDTINNEIKQINVKTETEENIKESLDIITKTFKTLYNNIDNDYGDSDNNKVILKTYLANKIIEKFEIIEKDLPDENSENYEKIKALRIKVNNIIQQNIKQENDKSFFFGDDTFYFKIIKNTKKLKLVLLDSVFIKQFYDYLVKIFLDLRDQLLQFDENDSEIKPEKKIDFIRRLIKEVNNFDQLNAKIKKDIIAANSNIAKEGIDMSKSGFEIISNLKQGKISDISQHGKNIVGNYEQIANLAIEKELLNKTANIIYYRKDETIKLIKEFDLKEKLKLLVEDERFNSKAFNGVIISRKINDPKDQLTEEYSVQTI